jgi:hypothetical protein
VLAVTFHFVLGSVLAVSTFGVTMVLLLLSYWPKSRPEESSPAYSAAAYNARTG